MGGKKVEKKFLYEGMCPGNGFIIALTTSSPGASVFDLSRIPPLSPASSSSIFSFFVTQKKTSSMPAKTKQVHYKWEHKECIL